LRIWIWQNDPDPQHWSQWFYHSCFQVSAELKMARSLVRLAEIQATLQEQRILFLRQQMVDMERHGLAATHISIPSDSLSPLGKWSTCSVGNSIYFSYMLVTRYLARSTV
jgi:hypothetical protein